MRGFSGLVVMGVCLAAAVTSGAGETMSEDLDRINPEFLVTPEEAYAWHAVKDDGGPTYAGSPSWKSYLAFLEAELEKCGVVDFLRCGWTYDRWHTTEWPDDANWTFVSDGAAVKVASYGAYSGATGEAGITAELVFYDDADPPQDVKGKIVVFQTRSGTLLSTLGDYEYRSEARSYPEPGHPVGPENTTSAGTFAQLVQTLGFTRTLEEGGAAGGVFVFDASYDRLAGMYTFPVPAPYDAPSLYLDRKAGEKVVEDAKRGKTATLKLLATTESAETYQLIGYLPGRGYGTAEDEKILLITHTDGPAISQENGGLGILGVVKYFSRIPRAQRPRTLMVFLDCRHYMPGSERAFAQQNWFAQNEKAWESIVGVVGIEHLGQVDYRETGEVYEPSGVTDPSRLYVTNNQTLVDMAVQAVKDNRLPNASVTNVDRPGVGGRSQGRWYGLGGIARRMNLPGFATMGSMGAYWATTGRIDRFDKDLFAAQVATMAQVTGGLMKADLAAIATQGQLESGAPSFRR